MKQICADPSCFITLENQNQFLKVLNELSNADLPIKVIVPTSIYQAIIKTPEEKFPALEKTLSDWNDSDMKLTYSISDRRKYVNNTRNMLRNFLVEPADKYIQNVEKLGTDSIYRNKVLEKIGRITGQIIFDILAISSEIKTSIVAFNNKTLDLISSLGIVVKTGHSKYKEKIRTDANIKRLLRFFQFMIGLSIVGDFFTEFEMEEIPLSTSELILGVMIVANG